MKTSPAPLTAPAPELVVVRLRSGERIGILKEMIDASGFRARVRDPLALFQSLVHMSCCQIFSAMDPRSQAPNALFLHCQNDLVDRTLVGIGISENGFSSAPASPRMNLMILLVGAGSDTRTYLQWLNRILSKLEDPAVRRRLLTGPTAAEAARGLEESPV